MARFEKWFTQNLQKPCEIQLCNGVVFSADNLSNLVGVEVYNGGSLASLSGSCVCYVNRANGDTVMFTGVVSGSRVYAVLPAACFAYPGLLGVSLQIVTGSGNSAEKTTVLKAVFSVEASTTGDIIDPGHVVPSLTELLALIDQMNTCITNANTATRAANTAATETSRVNISMTKSGQIITITTTNRNGANTSKTVQEPTAVATKSGEVVTVTVTDANGTTSQTLTDPVTRLLLLADDIPGTTSSIVYDSDGNVSGMLHKQNGSVFRTDTYTITDDTAIENRVLAAGGSLTMVTDLSTLETIVTYVAA